jgi:hypothetical protein
MSNDNNQELLKKLIDDDDVLEDIELQKKNHKKSPMLVATAIVVSDPKKGLASRRRAGRKGGSGCPCWCKCIGWTVLVFTLLSFFIIGCAYVWLNGILKEAVEQFTIESPLPKFDIIEMSASEGNIVVDRVMLFVEQLAAPKTTYGEPRALINDLVLTQDEINGFIGHSDYLRGNMMVSFHKNLIEEEYSLPMDVLGYDGRYLVGNDHLKLGTEELNNKNTIEVEMTTAATHEDWFDGPLFFAKIQYLITNSMTDEFEGIMINLFLEKGSIFGQDAPQDFIDEHQNLLDYLYYPLDHHDHHDDHHDKHRDHHNHSDYDDDIDVEAIRNVIANIESVSIEEGRIVVKARSD